MKKVIRQDVYIVDLSEGKGKAFKAIIPALNGAIVYGGSFRELEQGILTALEYEEKFGDGKILIGSIPGEYDFCIKNVSLGGTKNAYKASIKDSDIIIFGGNFRELWDSIHVSLKNMNNHHFQIEKLAHV